jgi:hypothetical protein
MSPHATGFSNAFEQSSNARPEAARTAPNIGSLALGMLVVVGVDLLVVSHLR